MFPVPTFYFWKVTVPVPVPAPYLDNKKQIFQEYIWNFFAFLHNKLFYTVLWKRNRNRNFLTSGTGTVTCYKVRTGTVIITVPELEQDIKLCIEITFIYNFLFIFYNNLLKFKNFFLVKQLTV